MGVDVYMSWKGFGRRTMTNPNYKNQITGFADEGKYGYLRIAYSDPYYSILSHCLCWDWDAIVVLTEKLLKEFEGRVRVLPQHEDYLINKKTNWLEFPKLARKLIKQGKMPRVSISY